MKPSVKKVIKTQLFIMIYYYFNNNIKVVFISNDI